MKTTEITGLNTQRTVEVVNALQQLLSDFQVHYTNLRHLHWFVKGHSFFIMHEKYEELYDDAAEKVDEVAERILQLDGDYRREPFTDILARKLFIGFQNGIFPAVIVQHLGYAGFEADLVRAAVHGVHIVCKGKYNFVISVIVGNCNLCALIILNG